MNNKETLRKINKNFLYNFLYEALIILSPLIITPYISRILGVELIGIRSYTFAILSYFELFANLGITMYGRREIARNLNDPDKKNRIFLELLTIKLIAFLIIFSVYCIVFFKCKILYEYKTLWIIWILHLMESFFNISWYFQGNEKYKLISIKGILLRILQIILTFSLVRGKQDFYLYLIIYATIPLLQGLTLWPFLKPDIHLKKIYFSNLKKHFKNIIIFFIPTISTTIYSNIDKIMLGTMIVSKKEIGYYESAQNIVLLATTIFTSIYTVMNSRISAELKNKMADYEYFIKVGLFMITSITFGLLAVSRTFILTFYGYEYQPVIKLLRLFCIIIVFIGLSSLISAIYIIPSDKQKYLSIFYIFATILNVIINTLFIPKFRTIGAIIGSIGAEGVVFIGCLLLSKKEISIRKYFIYGWQYLLCGLIMYIFISFLEHFLPITLYSLIIEIFIGILIYLFILLLLKRNNKKIKRKDLCI